MKFNIRLTAVLLFISFAVSAQNKEILFEKTELKAALAKARLERKPVFVDCYTTWCGPCKGMDATVFKNDSVADFFNAKFISVKLDMEKGEGPEAKTTYKVGAFPTYLLFDENGNQIYKFVGGMPANEFMAKIRVGMNPKNEIAVRETRYAAGDRDHALLRGLIKQKFKQKENKVAQDISAEYLGLLSDAEKVKPENWFLFGESFESMFISDIGSTNFNYLMDHYKEFTVENSKEAVDSKIYSTYKKLAEYCLVGYHFKSHPFSITEFENYKKQINRSKFEDKNQLLILIDIAIAAGEKDSKKAGKLLADHVGSFTQKNMSVVFNYITFCSSLDRNFPYMKEIADVIKAKSNNSFLVDFCAKYSEKSSSSNPVTNE
jgi:thiol-disulfide isomerase/thioredoxin